MDCTGTQELRFGCLNNVTYTVDPVIPKIRSHRRCRWVTHRVRKRELDLGPSLPRRFSYRGPVEAPGDASDNVLNEHVFSCRVHGTTVRHSPTQGLESSSDHGSQGTQVEHSDLQSNQEFLRDTLNVTLSSLDYVLSFLCRGYPCSRCG